MEKIILSRGGIYLARLDPAKHIEVGKIRPVIVFTAQKILNVTPPFIFVCPLSSHSDPETSALHVELTPRDNLHATSYALVEHCRAITIQRLIHPRLAQLTNDETHAILHRLQRMLGL